MSFLSSLWKFLPWHDLPTVLVFCLFVVGYLYNGVFVKEQKNSRPKTNFPPPSRTQSPTIESSPSSTHQQRLWWFSYTRWIQDTIRRSWRLLMRVTDILQRSRTTTTTTTNQDTQKSDPSHSRTQKEIKFRFLVSTEKDMDKEEQKLQELCLRAMEQSTTMMTTTTSTSTRTILPAVNNTPTTVSAIAATDRASHDVDSFFPLNKHTMTTSRRIDRWHQRISEQFEEELQRLEQVIEQPGLAHPNTQQQARDMRKLLYSNIPRINIIALRWYRRASEILMDTAFVTRRLDVLLMEKDGVLIGVQQIIDDCHLLQSWADQGLATLPVSLWTVSHDIVAKWLQTRYKDVVGNGNGAATSATGTLDPKPQISKAPDTSTHNNDHGIINNRALTSVGRAWYLLSMSLLLFVQKRRTQPDCREILRSFCLEELLVLSWDYLDRARVIQSRALDCCLWYIAQGLYNVAKLEQQKDPIRTNNVCEDLFQASAALREPFYNVSTLDTPTRATHLLMALSRAIQVVHPIQTTDTSTGFLFRMPFFNTKGEKKNDTINHTTRVLPIYRNQLHHRLNEAYEACAALSDTCHLQCQHYFCDTTAELEYLTQLELVIQQYRRRHFPISEKQNCL